MNTKKTLSRFGIFVLGLMLAVSYASAGNVTVVITQNSFPTYNGQPIGPYGGTLNGNPALFTCLDLFLETNVGQPYTGSLIAATTTAEKEAVWLTDQENVLLSQTHTPQNDTTAFGDLNWAVWNVIDPSGVDITGLPGAQTDVANAAAAVAAGYVPDHPIFNPDDTNSQSFSVVSSATPEPGTLAMMGTGMLGLAGVLRRKLSK
jgi:PEP-CTERM motif